MIYKTDENIYSYDRPAESSHMASTYTRYLIDTCEHIFVVPQENLKLNPDSNNPFNERMNPGFKLEQRVIEPDEKVTISDIPMVEN